MKPLFPLPKFPSSNVNKYVFFMTSHGKQNSKSMQPHSYPMLSFFTWLQEFDKHLGTYLIVGLILLLQIFLEEAW
jgi:hypothetical protein